MVDEFVLGAQQELHAHAALMPLSAQADEKPQAGSTATADACTATDMTEDEMRKFDLEAGRMRLEHANINNLDMPAKKMIFFDKDKALIDQLKAGNKARFRALDAAGKFTVSHIQPAR